MDALPEILHPSHTSLIMVDMQNDFVSAEGSLASAGKSASEIYEAVSQSDVQHAADELRRYMVGEPLLNVVQAAV